MSNYKKRALSILLVLAMTLSAIPFPALALGSAGDATEMTIGASSSAGEGKLVSMSSEGVISFNGNWPLEYEPPFVSVGLAAEGTTLTYDGLNSSAFIYLSDGEDEYGAGRYRYFPVDLAGYWGAPIPVGRYYVVVFAGIEGGGEQVFYSNATIEVVDGVGMPYDMSETTVNVTGGGTVGQATQLTLELDFGVSDIVTIQPTDTLYLDLFISGDEALSQIVDFSEATVTPNAFTLTPDDTYSRCELAVSTPYSIPAGGKLTIVIDGIVPSVEEATAIIKFMNGESAALGHWDGTLTFNAPTDGANVSASTLTATSGSSVGEPTSLTLAIKGTEDFAVEQYDTVTITAVGIDFFSSTIESGSGMSIDAWGNGYITLAFDAATTITAAEGVTVTINNVTPSQQSVTPSLTLRFDENTAITKNLSNLTFSEETLRLVLELSDTAWIVQSDGSLQNGGMTVTAKVIAGSGTTVATDVSGYVSFALSGGPYATINRESSCRRQLVNGVATLDVTSLGTYSLISENTAYTLRAQFYTPEGILETAEENIIITAAARKISGHVTLTSGAAYDDALVTITQAGMSGYSQSTGIYSYPEMKLTVRTDENGYYEAFLPSPREHGYGAAPYYVSVARNDERKIYEAFVGQGVPELTTAPDTTVNVVCDNYVTIMANVYSHGAREDNDFIGHRDEASLLTAGTSLFWLDIPAINIKFNTGRGVDITYLGNNTWAMPHKKMKELTNNGAEALEFRAITRPGYNGMGVVFSEQALWNYELFDTFTYSSSVNEYTLNFDAIPFGAVEVYNPDVFNDGGNGYRAVARVLMENPDYDPDSPLEMYHSQYIEVGHLGKLAPGKLLTFIPPLTYDSFDEMYNVLVFVADERYAPQLGNGIDRWNIDEGGVPLLPGLDADEYEVFTGTIGLGKKFRVETDPIPYDSTRHADFPDNPNLRVLSIKGNIATVAYSFEAIQEEKSFNHLEVRISNGLELHAMGIGEHLEDSYILLSNGDKMILGAANQPDGSLLIGSNGFSMGYVRTVVPPGETCLVVMTFTILNPEAARTIHSVSVGMARTHFDEVFRNHATLEFSADWSLSMSTDAYTSSSAINVTGMTKPEGTVKIYVNDVLAGTVTANKAGSWQTAVYLFTGTVEEGAHFELYAESEGRVTPTKDVQYTKRIPQVIAFSDMNNKAMIYSLPLNQVTKTIDYRVPGTSIVYKVETLNPNGSHLWDSVTDINIPADSHIPRSQADFKKSYDDWQWCEIGQYLLKYDPGHEVEYRVATDLDEAISKVWVNIYNGTGGTDLSIPAIYDAEKGCWIAKDIIPATDFWPLEISVEFTMKIGAELVYGQEEIADGIFIPVLDYEALLDALREDLSKITISDEIRNNENLASEIWTGIVDANPALANATVTDHGGDAYTVDYNIDGTPQTMTGSIKFWDMEDPGNQAVAEAMFTSPDAWPLGSDGAYTVVSTVEYIQNGQTMTMDYVEFLWMMAKFETMAAAKAFFHIEDDIVVRTIEAMRLPSQGAAPFMQTFAAGDMGSLGIEFDGAIFETAVNWSLAAFDLFGDAEKLVSRFNAGNVLAGVGNVLGLKGIWDTVWNKKDVDYMWNCLNDAYWSLQDMTSTECFEMMTSDEKQDWYDLMAEYHEASKQFDRFKFNNDLISGGKIIFSSTTVAMSAATMGGSGTVTQTGAEIITGKVLTATGVGTDIAGMIYEANATNKIMPQMGQWLNRLTEFEHSFSKRLMLKCREKYNRYETMAHLNRKSRIIYDPSGFAYENGDITQRVSYVNAEIWTADDASGTNARLWTEAEEYDQINPQLTGEEGWYAWDVPIGWWQVRLTKDGYQEARSEWLPVLPVQLGINLEMIRVSNGGQPQTPKDGSDETPEGWSNPFTDVKEEHWYYSDVVYVHRNGLFKGTSANTFSPEMSMTRGMVVTVLGRLAGIDTADYAGASFDDVDTEVYYAPYIKWAAEKGIVNGIGDNKFAPNADISRQDLAVILARYADVMDLTMKQTLQNAVFVDADAIAEYAVDAVATMVRAGVINGKPGNLFDPTSSATRAEVAAMLHRFCEAVQ